MIYAKKKFVYRGRLECYDYGRGNLFHLVMLTMVAITIIFICGLYGFFVLLL